MSFPVAVVEQIEAGQIHCPRQFRGDDPIGRIVDGHVPEGRSLPFGVLQADHFDEELPAGGIGHDGLTGDQLVQRGLAGVDREVDTAVEVHPEGAEAILRLAIPPGADVAILLPEEGGFLVISLYNYAGAECVLSPRDMAKLGNGFAFDVRDAADYPSFAAFQAEMRTVRTLDQLYSGVRRVHYARPELRLSLVLCPYTNTVMQRSINGRTADTPHLALGDGGKQGLPFLTDATNVGFADWDWLTTQVGRDAETYNPSE
jgi:hypothetical protein